VGGLKPARSRLAVGLALHREVLLSLRCGSLANPRSPYLSSSSFLSFTVGCIFFLVHFFPLLDVSAYK
jgi:VIT1/CCC1 family predicted Fe2+/Mn2+ transporter